MDEHTAFERAYKNGYEAGYEAGNRDAHRWIPVKERLPEEMEWVLCVSIHNTVHILGYDYIMDDWDIHGKPNSCYGKNFVTHWMPLPEPPEGSGEKA